MDYLLLLVSFLAVLLLHYVYRRWTYKGPPHMTGLPFLGYLPFLGQVLYLKLQELTDRHGPIISFYMGSVYTVILGNYSAIHEAFVVKGTNFNARPSSAFVKVFKEQKNFALLDGEEWRVTRNFTMSTLKNYGFGKEFTENFLQLEVQDLIGELRDFDGKPINVYDHLCRSNSCLFLSLVTGSRYERTDPWVESVRNTTHALLNSYRPQLLLFFPVVKSIPLLNRFLISRKTKALKLQLGKLLEVELKRAKPSCPSGSEPENFVHSWLLEGDIRRKNNDQHQQLFSEYNLKDTVEAIIQAAGETTPTTINWAFLYLLIHPDIQEKLHEEIDRVIGSERRPAVDDIKATHYARAFVMEVHRRATIGPLGFWHGNVKKDVLLGYEIPANSVVIGNLWSIHHDPEYFPEPYKFHPERFLDDQGSFLPSPHVNAFSLGRRICPGKSVAEMQIYMYLLSILQVFQLESPKDVDKLSDQDSIFENMLIRRPKSFDIVFKPRRQHHHHHQQQHV